MNNLGLVCNSYDVIDQSRESSRRPDMPDLATAKSVQLRVEQFCDEIVLFTSMEKIDRYEQGRSVGQEIPGKVT
ncbi:hypothetical protein JQK15_24785 [Sphingobium sp. BHU LFT2]|uniref:hypothetical protein n=1 Tax=Sphingobium sp. BHU LFT2 TaxID=2807634 RepID=UPI001BECEFFD|nr:hypothetical protein [Sphingobium sp. BHU LFT2]MBT2246728.1 hypothetical protein [Sphingobium sp. BHU LFT2]